MIRQRTTAPEPMQGQGPGVQVSGHTISVGRRRPHGNAYNGPFSVSLALDDSGDDATPGKVNRLSVSPGRVYAGHAHKACDWTADGDGVWGADGVDINNNALAAGDYALAIVTDVDPDTGDFDDADSTANTYGPTLQAIPLADQTVPSRDAADCQAKSMHTSADGVALGAAVTLLATFTVNADLTFGNLKQLWQGADVYVPVYGWTLATTAGSENEAMAYPQLWAPWNSTTPTSVAATMTWFEAGWRVNLNGQMMALKRWMEAHYHHVLSFATSLDGDPAHTHTVGPAGGSFDTEHPRWSET